jgi:imidazolonepropionase-like amidohydrolase
MTYRSIAILAFFALPAAAAEPQAYRAARLWPGDGPVIVDAVLIVRDGKVVAAGKRADVKVPDDAVMHDLGDATIIPGLVIAETTLADRGKDDLHVLTPHYRAIDGFDPFGDYSSLLAGGVTTVQLSPGGKRLLPGQGSVVKLFGDDLVHRTLRDEESLRLVLGDGIKSPPRIYEPPVGAVSVDRPLEPTRPQLGGGLANVMAGLRAAFQAARADRSTNDMFLKSIADAGTSKKPLRVSAPSTIDVQAALALAKELDLRLILVDPPAATADQLQSWKSNVDGVILNPGVRPGMSSDGSTGDDAGPAATPAARNRRRNPAPAPAREKGKAAAKKLDDEAPGSPAEVARDLRAAGLRVAIKPMQDADLKEVLYLGGLFTTHATSADALKMLTADAAGLLGVADRVGTLAAGKDADFIVLGGEPFGLHTRVRSVYVDGQTAYDATTAARSKVIRGARLLNGSGESINNGAVLVEGRTIRAVGRDVSTPADAEEKRFAGAVIVPGFLDLGNGLGLGGPLNSTIGLNTKLGARLVSGEPAAAAARQGGVTTVLLSAPAPSPVLAFKLGDKLRPVKDPVALRFAVRGNLTQAGASLRDTLKAAKTYCDSWTKYEAELPEYQTAKKEYDVKIKEWEKKAEAKKDEKKDAKKEEKKPEEEKPEEPKAPTKPQANDALEPYRALFAGKIPALVEAKREDAIRLAITICRDEFNLRTILIGCDDAYRVADMLAEKNVAAIAGPELVRTIERNEVNLPLSLAMRGVPVGYQSQATSGAKHLPLAVGFAVRHGLGSDDALRGLTAAPAQFLGLESIGSLAVGKDADLVVLSGMPFEASTRVLAVMIDGQWVYTE